MFLNLYNYHKLYTSTTEQRVKSMSLVGNLLFNIVGLVCKIWTSHVFASIDKKCVYGNCFNVFGYCNTVHIKHSCKLGFFKLTKNVSVRHIIWIY